MARLPQVSGAELGRLLQQLGYEFMRQKGSHARYRLISSAGTYFVTVPMHPVIAKGIDLQKSFVPLLHWAMWYKTFLGNYTLNDILSSVSVRTGVAKDDLIDQL